jgi:hypothetical protein
VIGRNHGPGAAHILHDNTWISSNIFSQIGSEQAAVLIIVRSRRTAHDKLYALSLVEWGLGLEAGGQCQRKEKAKDHSLHAALLSIN